MSDSSLIPERQLVFSPGLAATIGLEETILLQHLQVLLEHRDALYEIRHRAFSDLVSERVLADQSFTIFQNHMRDEFAAVEARIKEKMA